MSSLRDFVVLLRLIGCMARRTPEVDRRRGRNPKGKYGLPCFLWFGGKHPDGVVVCNDGRLWRISPEVAAIYSIPLMKALTQSEETAHAN